MSKDNEFKIVVETLRLAEVNCSKCGKHSGWALLSINFVCDECKPMNEERSCEHIFERVTDSTGYIFQRCVKCGFLPRR